MSVRICIDSVNGAAPTAGVIRVEQGNPIIVAGWGFDAEAGLVPTVLAQAGAKNAPVGGTVVAREDVARHFRSDALLYSGFSITLRGKLRLGLQDIALGYERDGSFVPVTSFRIMCIEPKIVERPWPRVAIAACAGSDPGRTTTVLGRYFATSEPAWRDAPHARGQRLDARALELLRSRAFVLRFVLRSDEEQRAELAAASIFPLVLWRNVADSIVAYDALLCGGAPGVDAFPGLDVAEYRRLPDQTRQRFLVRYALPAQVEFFRAWRDAAFVARYERLVAHPTTYFSGIIEAIAGQVDAHKLAEAIAVAEAPDDTAALDSIRSRPVAELSPEMRAVLESALRDHVEDLSELIAELPWNRDPGAPSPSAASRATVAGAAGSRDLR